MIIHPGFDTAPKPRPYQEAGAFSLSRARRWLLADDPGLGKTGQALLALGLLPPHDPPRRVLILCPASARLTWLREVAKWVEGPSLTAVFLGGNEVWFCSSVRGGPTRRFREVGRGWQADPRIHDPHFYIANYDLVPKEREFFVRFPGHRFPRWDVVILDEAHMLASPDTLRTASVIGRWGKDRQTGLCEKASRVWALTGTPIQNRPIDFHPLLRTIAPAVFPVDRHKYAVKYCNAKKIRFGKKTVWDYTGASRVEELHARLKFCMTRRLKGEVLTELPPKTREVVTLPATPSARALLAKEWEEVSALTGVEFPEDADCRARLASIGEEGLRAVHTNMHAGQASKYRAALGKEKCAMVAAHIADALEGGREKVLVFTAHTELAEGLLERLGKDYEVVEFLGKTGPAAREASVKAFHEGSARVMVGNIVSAGTNLTLHAHGRCSLAVLAEPDFVPARCFQAEDRIHRFEQVNPVLVQYLVVEDSIEAAVVERMLEKHAVIAQVLDGAEVTTPFGSRDTTTS